jgi:hypothetical protein
LLSLAWRARSAASVADDTTPQQYAGDLQRFARDHPGDIDSFHGGSYPADPLPGQAGELVSSYTEGHDDLDLSLETALILFNALSTAAAPADEPTELRSGMQGGARTSAAPAILPPTT